MNRKNNPNAYYYRFNAPGESKSHMYVLETLVHDLRISSSYWRVGQDVCGAVYGTYQRGRKLPLGRVQHENSW